MSLDDVTNIPGAMQPLTGDTAAKLESKNGEVAIEVQEKKQIVVIHAASPTAASTAASESDIESGEELKTALAQTVEKEDEKKEGEDEDLSWASFVHDIKSRTGREWAGSFGRIGLALFFLYFFLFGLDLMGTSFKILGGCAAGELFKDISNPIAGLMIGILATVLVQSSSTSTSIVVSLVGAGAMDVQTAIPVIMGANIGTSVTNTIVSMGHMQDRGQLEKAFAGATVHDMFNMLAVVVMLPLEEMTHMLYHLTDAMKPSSVEEGEKWEGPIKKLVAPLVKQILVANKNVIKDVAKGTTSCSAIYADPNLKGLIKCDSEYGCPLFYVSDASQGDDMAAGSVCLFISLVVLVVCLVGLVKLLQHMVMGKSQLVLRKATNLHWLISIAIGTAITILVQSSSITTSVLTPLVGLSVIELEQMFPLTLGANIGTTFTALLASMVSDKPEAVQIALVHLFFNLISILIWYPIPWMRQWPLRAARGLGHLTKRYHLVPALYLLVAFVIVPGLLLGVSVMFDSGPAIVVLGVLIVISVTAWAVYTVYWWKFQQGREKTWAALERREVMSTTLKDLPESLKKMRADIDKLMGVRALTPSLSPSPVKLITAEASQAADPMPRSTSDSKTPV